MTGQHNNAANSCKYLAAGWRSERIILLWMIAFYLHRPKYLSTDFSGITRFILTTVYNTHDLAILLCIICKNISPPAGWCWVQTFKTEHTKLKNEPKTLCVWCTAFACQKYRIIIILYHVKLLSTLSMNMVKYVVITYFTPIFYNLTFNDRFSCIYWCSASTVCACEVINDYNFHSM